MALVFAVAGFRLLPRPATLTANSASVRQYAAEHLEITRSRRHQFALALALLLVAVGLRGYLEWVAPMPGDRWAAEHWREFTPGPRWEDIARLFQLLGDPLFAAPTLLLGIWFTLRSAGPRAAAFVLFSSVGVAVNSLLKILSGPTPLWVEWNGLTPPNFPSGHANYAVTVWGALAIVAWSRGRRDIAWTLMGAAALMGPTRLIAGAHILSDVVAGALTGAAWLLASVALMRQPAPVGRTGATNQEHAK